jgi:hypothetical protein
VRLGLNLLTNGKWKSWKLHVKREIRISWFNFLLGKYFLANSFILSRTLSLCSFVTHKSKVVPRIFLFSTLRKELQFAVVGKSLLLFTTFHVWIHVTFRYLSKISLLKTLNHHHWCMFVNYLYWLLLHNVLNFKSYFKDLFTLIKFFIWIMFTFL